ncbi:MAG: thiolase family protein, partial [bacterium]|nr:thiolase family protein [bacterium]
LRDRKKGEYVFNTDEHARDGVTADKLKKLPTVFKKDGSVHAGNASGITDGGAAVVVLSAKAAEQHGVTPMARLVADTEAGIEPKVRGLGPVPAVEKLVAETGLSVGDIDLWELNEAFAAQVIACNRELKIDEGKLNVEGGSIALGHPIGATGCRILVTLLHSMAARDAKRGVATLCISGGLGIAVLVERD